MKQQNTQAARKAAQQQQAPIQLFTPPVHVKYSLADSELILHPAPHPVRDAVFQQLQQLNAPLLRGRNMVASGTITNEHGIKRTKVPAISFSGKWLHTVGFTQMDRYFLYAYEGMIILVPQGPPAPPEARQSWEGLPPYYGKKRSKTAEEIRIELLNEELKGAIVSKAGH